MDDLVEHLKTHMPLTSVEARVREIYKPEKIEGYRPSWYTSKIWIEESGPGEYYHGLSFRINEDDPSGSGAIRGYTSAQLVSAQTDMVVGRRTLVHEIGHNLSLKHAPGCDAGSVDPDFPYETNLIEDEKGWRMWEKLFLDEGEAYDFMGYCNHGAGTTHHISQYNFAKAGRFYRDRIAEEEDTQDSSAAAGGIVISRHPR